LTWISGFIAHCCNNWSWIVFSNDIDVYSLPITSKFITPSTCRLQYLNHANLSKWNIYLFHRLFTPLYDLIHQEKLKWPSLCMLRLPPCSFIWFLPGLLFTNSTTKILITFYGWNRMTLVCLGYAFIIFALVLGTHPWLANF
jgi:hypothetical protein